jgi:hypothetical protein
LGLVSKEKGEAKTETLTNQLNGKTVKVKTVGHGSRERVLVMKEGEAAKREPEEKELKAKKSKAAKAEAKAGKPKSPRRGVDYWMPTLAQVAGFVEEQAGKGAVTLTATQIRTHFGVPGKMSMNTRMGQLAKAGFGAFSLINGSNTLILDVEAVKSGKASIKAKQSEPKTEEKRGKAKIGKS